MEQFRTYGVTHPGAVRQNNEDAFVDRPELGIWAVADGAGGHDAGEVASETVATALQSLPGELTAEELLAKVRECLREANTALQSLANEKGEGTIVATTVVVLVIRHGHFACLWAGDSRAYLLRNGELLRVTRDHSLVQQLVDAGKITADDAERHPNANIITRAVGVSDSVELDKVTGPLVEGDRFLLCSDGLPKALEENALAEILAADEPRAAAEGLLEAALSHEARDNVTVVVVGPV